MGLDKRVNKLESTSKYCLEDDPEPMSESDYESDNDIKIPTKLASL